MKEQQLKSGNHQLILLFCGTIFVSWIGLQTLTLFWYNIPFPQGFKDSIISAFIFSVFCFIISNVLHFYQPGKERYSYILVWVLSLASLSTYFSKLIVDYFIADVNYLDFVKASLPLRFIASFLLIGCAAIINVLWNSQKSQSEQEKRRTDAEKLAREAELYNLRQQLQPHFLFNSFEEEVEHLKLYLEIEKVRFGHRLNIKINIPSDSLKKQLPAMIVQPLLENAIKYGLYDTTDQVTIRIETITTPTSLDIQITNPFDNNNNSDKRRSGFGLRSVERRLFLLYGRADLLKTKQENNSFIAQLKIPQQND